MFSFTVLIEIPCFTCYRAPPSISQLPGRGSAAASQSKVEELLLTVRLPEFAACTSERNIHNLIKLQARSFKANVIGTEILVRILLEVPAQSRSKILILFQALFTNRDVFGLIIQF